MKAADFAAACKRTATNYKTAYMLGTFGWPATAANISRAIKSNGTNAVRPAWQSKAYGIQDKGFLFDCVGLIKGILWGWNGSLTATYGGGKYASNGVPDVSDSGMIGVCSGVSADFRNIQVGEVVWLPGHIGVYIGDGLAVDALRVLQAAAKSLPSEISARRPVIRPASGRNTANSPTFLTAHNRPQRLRLQPALRSEMWFILSAENIIRAQLQRPEMSSKQATQRLLLFPRSARTNTTSFTPITQVPFTAG